MPGFNTIPVTGGGGGQPNMTYVGSVYMETFNRSWAQGGTSGFYGIFSANQETGYAYFVGTGATTGIPLNKMSSVNHSFTRIDIVSKPGDMVSLYKIKVKTTTVFTAGLPNFPYSTTVGSSAEVVTTTGNHSKPAGSLSLVNVLLVGGGGGAGGGHGDTHGGGGGGGGGNVVKLFGMDASAPVYIEIGAGGPASPGSNQGNDGGKTFFGNVYALGGGGGGGWNNKVGRSLGNGGGGGGGQFTGTTSSTGIVQTASIGLDVSGALDFQGGRSGGSGNNGNSTASRGGGGGGAMADGTSGGSSGNGGVGLVDNISGSNIMYGGGGYGSTPNNTTGTSGYSSYSGSGQNYGSGGQGIQGANHNSPVDSVIGNAGVNGAVVVRSYTV